MNTNETTIAKPINELSAAEIREFLAKVEADEQNQKQEARRNYEGLRDQTVNEIVKLAETFEGVLKDFKTRVWGDLEAMYKMLQEYSTRHADGKGSFTLENSESTMKVQFKRQDNTRFDERATQAEKHILDFITQQFGDDAPTSKLVRRLLERKKGSLDKDQVLHLISMKDDFDNENWRTGMQLLQESIVPGETKYYAQFFTKAAKGDSWQPIVLDFAKL